MLCALTLERDVSPPVSWSWKGRTMPGDLTQMTDGELALAWRKGDTEALRALVDRHRAAAFGLALRLCGDRDRAEDLAQEAFLRAIDRMHQYNPAEPFRPWLNRIMGHLQIDWLRRQREIPDEMPDHPQLAGDGDSEIFLQTVLNTLSPAHRTVLVLRELGGLSYDELAHYFHIPVGTVRSRLAHARVAFKDAYTRLGKEGSR